MQLGFEVRKTSQYTESRIGSLLVDGAVVKTPAIWFGHSLKSSLVLARENVFRSDPIMVSYGDVFDRPNLAKKIVERGIHDHLDVSCPVMMDSGGFKLSSNKIPDLNVANVSKFFTAATANINVTLDYPMSLVASRADNAERLSKTLGNLRRLSDALGEVRLMPVIHGLNLDQIRKSCISVREITESPLVVGLGGLVPLITSRVPNSSEQFQLVDGSHGSGIDFVGGIVQQVKEYFPSSLIHMFGVGSTTTVLAAFALGVDSIDSTSWRMKAAFGKIHLPGVSDRALSHAARIRKSNPLLTNADKEQLMECKCSICSEGQTLEDRVRLLKSSFKSRALHNAWIIKQEIASYHRVIGTDTESQFLFARVKDEHRFSGLIKKLVSSS